MECLCVKTFSANEKTSDRALCLEGQKQGNTRAETEGKENPEHVQCMYRDTQQLRAKGFDQ